LEEGVIDEEVSSQIHDDMDLNNRTQNEALIEIHK
jgi:hypothetical protein